MENGSKGIEKDELRETMGLFAEKVESKELRGIKSGWREGSDMCFWSPVGTVKACAQQSLWGGCWEMDELQMQREYE